ncbi:ArnT family glycosyltransferase [Mycolicibacterium celeriflavum]|uniref:ArnT family glycosyltransferase n=1 Tax=Mycolicibacterium celeriflavum TaxID=1249101 RepID=UPI003CF156E5
MTVTDARRPAPSASPAPAERIDARWVRPAHISLLLATAVLYLWGLGSNGWANDYYAAAAQAGTQDWKAWLFGSLDAGNAITVDKPPAALWLMALSGGLFGFNAFTMLLPQAVMGVGSVAVLYAAVRRISGPAAGLIAGAALALTPVAALMFRFNNPDALLVLLMVVAAYCVVRATGTGSIRWMAFAGCALGFAFLTKMLQAFLVMPGLALAFLVAAPVGMWRRIWTLAVGGVTMVVSAGWYLALVELWPAGSRPYIGGSTDNSLLQLALGYNGIERIAGGSAPGGMGPGPGGPGGGRPLFFGGEPGIGRMFGDSMGTQASWLLPAALIGLVAGLWFTRRSSRTDAVRAALLMWGGWLLVTAAVFSFMDGTIHPYYTVALAPAVAALVAISARELWCDRRLPARAVLATMSAATGVWAFMLLSRTPDWWPAVRWLVLVGSVLVALALVFGAHRLGRATTVLAVAAAVLGVAGPTAYTLATVANAHGGPMVVAGPSVGVRGFADDGPGRHAPPGGPGRFGPGADNPALENLVREAPTRWAAATIGSMTASSLELKTGASVMAIGGFTGSDDSPTLEQFQAYVAHQDVRYFIADGHGGPPRRNNASAAAIATWVQQNFTRVDVGGVTVYDLFAPVAS